MLPATRPNLPSAVASEDKEKRRSILPIGDFLWLLGPLFLPKLADKNMVPTKHKKAGGGKPPAFAQRAETYLISAFAPASSNFFLASSAAAFGTDSLTGFGAPSTRSFASFRPRPVSSRTALITETLFAPTSVRLTVNSVCSSASAAAPPPAV